VTSGKGRHTGRTDEKNTDPHIPKENIKRTCGVRNDYIDEAREVALHTKGKGTKGKVVTMVWVNKGGEGTG